MNLWTKIIYKELEFLFHVECLRLITSYNIFSPYSIDELVGPPYTVILAPPLATDTHGPDQVRKGAEPKTSRRVRRPNSLYTGSEWVV
jgi:hypothetical protein